MNTNDLRRRMQQYFESIDPKDLMPIFESMGYKFEDVPSKPYFAKYLPVEGEIKMGDKFIDTGVMNMIGTRRNKEGKYDFQKVKLFLCSRDIQVGDKAFDKDDNYEYGEVRKIIEGEAYFNTSDLDARRLSALYKVIGEISPDATWVKEGDEFDEIDLEEWQYTDEDWYLPVGLSSIKGLPTKFKIKCPHCGKFQ